MGEYCFCKQKNIFKVEIKQFKNKLFKYCSLTYSKQIVVFNY